MELRTRQAFIAAVLTVYVVSFFLPVINAIPGWGVLLMNLFVVWVPSWAANPLLLVGLYSFNHGQYGKTAILGFIALLLGTIWLWGLLFDHDQNTGLGPGYWVWLGSMALLILGAAICACQKETFC